MSKLTKVLQFDAKTRKRIQERDQECLFCRQQYHMECTSTMLLEIMDIMHYVPKSKQGLGIEQNGVLGCRYHHGLLDNGNKGLRQEMLARMQTYLKKEYQGWDQADAIYKKYNF